MISVYEYECKKCGLKNYSSASPETLLYKTCLDKNCNGEVELSKLGREMRYGKEETKQILDKE
jgi:hypothetical protein